MSIGKIAKDEILNAKLHSRHAKMAYLSAFIHTAGSIFLSDRGMQLVLYTENTLVKDSIDSVLKSVYKSESIEKTGSIVIEGSYLLKLLTDCGILKVENGESSLLPGIQKTLIVDQESKIAYLRGAFLGCGSVSIASGYHFEFAFSNSVLALDVSNLLNEFSINAKSTVRKDKYLVYLKEMEAISDILALLGASKAVLELNNRFVGRQANKSANRAKNCDMANIDKLIRSRERLSNSVDILKSCNAYDSLDEKLKSVAACRLDNPDLSLNELAVMLGITKSCAAHRLNKIITIANSIKK